MLVLIFVQGLIAVLCFAYLTICSVLWFLCIKAIMKKEISSNEVSFDLLLLMTMFTISRVHIHSIRMN